MSVSDPSKIPAFIPDPALSQVTANMTGTVVFDPAGGGTVNSKGWFAIGVLPASDSTYYYNADSTKTMLLPAGVMSIIFVPNNPKVTITFGAGTNYVQAM